MTVVPNPMPAPAPVHSARRRIPEQLRPALPWLVAAATSTSVVLLVEPSVIGPALGVGLIATVVGVALLIGARRRRVSWGWVCGSVGLTVALGVLSAVSPVLALIGGMLFVAPIAIPLVAALILVLTGRGGPPLPPRPVVAAIASSVVGLAISAAVVVDILVWTKLAAVPTMTLGEIDAAMRARGEGGSEVLVVALATAFAIATLIVAGVVVWRRLAPGPALAWVLAPASAMLVGRWALGFGVGMSLGDTFDVVDPLSAAEPVFGLLVPVLAWVMTWGALATRVPAAPTTATAPPARTIEA